MKPHEETWKVDEQAVKDGDYTATDSDGFAVLTTYAREEGGSDELAEARLRLAAAAPEMARALLEVGEAIAMGTLDEEGAGEVIRRALAKAGVLP